MLEHLIHCLERLCHWGYLVIFLIVMLEGQALVGLFMPDEGVVFVSGGIISSTFLTLLLLPVLYDWVERKSLQSRQNNELNYGR
jgi:hypothetical protein